ncbi:MAG: acyltransferase [bacterium]
MRKISYLDGLRGLAAFVVVFHHFILAFYPALLLGGNTQAHLVGKNDEFVSGTLLNLFYNGNFAVCIFFVLSGFVLSHKFFLHRDREILKESAIKRYLRLVVPVAFSVLLAFVLMEFSLFYNQQAADLSGSNWLGGFWKFAPNFFDAINQIFVGAFFTNIFEYNDTLWTIAYEFIGSLLVFGFLALFGKMKRRWIFYVLASVILFQTYYWAFILGVMLSDIVANEKKLLSHFDRSKIFRTLLLLIGLFLGSYPSMRGVEGTIYAPMEQYFLVNSAVFYHIVGAFFVILVLLDSRRMQKIFSFRYLLFLGEISFAMYLLHFIVLGSLSSFIFMKIGNNLPYAQAFFVSFTVSIAFIFIVSFFTYKYVDKKAVYYSKLFYQRFFGKK